jgi:hypothetical protein
MKALDERVSATTVALAAMLMQTGIIFTAEDRTALRLRVYVGLTQIASDVCATWARKSGMY